MPATSPASRLAAMRSNASRTHGVCGARWPAYAGLHSRAVAKLARQRRRALLARKVARYMAPGALPLASAAAMLALAALVALAMLALGGAARPALQCVALLLGGAGAFVALAMLAAGHARRAKLARQRRRARVAGIIASANARLAARLASAA